jgi:DNA-binding beta-propeller fold protein YncE
VNTDSLNVPQASAEREEARREIPVSKSSFCSSTWLRSALVYFLLIPLSSFLQAEEQYIVTSVDGTVNVYNLSDNSFVESFGAGANPFQLVVSPNHRIGYFANLDLPYTSAVDFTIQREIDRFDYGVWANENHTAALTPDGKLLLIPTHGGALDVIRTSDFRVIQRVDLNEIAGPPTLVEFSSVVVVNNKAYINTSENFSRTSAVAVVDLTTFQATGIPVPQDFYNNTFFAGDTAATPDGKFVLMLQSSSVLLIDTSTDTLVANIALPTAPYLIAVTPKQTRNKVFAYIVCGDGNGGIEAEVMDLRSGSPTFGQLIPGAVVELSYTGFLPVSIALNGDGTRLIAMALQTVAPEPDTFILDTAAMLTNPQKAILSQLRLEKSLGPYLHNVTIAAVETAPPPGAPVVTAVSGSLINDQSGTLDVAGSNFAEGSFVRIGAMVPIGARKITDTSLQVNVPQDAPAGDGLDVIVTNRNVNAPLSQQQQSGLLAHRLTISPNPAFQPHQQVVAADMSEGAISILLPSGIMKTFHLGHEPGTFAFAPDGVHVYVISATQWRIACFNLQTNKVEKVIIPPQGGALYQGGLFVSKSPSSGSPVVYAATFTTNGCEQACPIIDLLQIDANSSSPTFNEIVNTYTAAPPGIGAATGSGAATPDGRFVYVFLQSTSPSLTIFDIVKGTTATFSGKALGLYSIQRQVTVTADGASLLLNTPQGGIAVFDISAKPLNPTLITTIDPVPVPRAAHLFLYSYAVLGKKLFAFDNGNNAIEMFNFDRGSQNYAFLGANVISGRSALGAFNGIAVSADGKLVYVPQNGEDALAVLDADLLGANEPALITKLATGRVPHTVAINPVPW